MKKLLTALFALLLISTSTSSISAQNLNEQEISKIKQFNRLVNNKCDDLGIRFGDLFTIDTIYSFQQTCWDTAEYYVVKNNISDVKFQEKVRNIFNNLFGNIIKNRAEEWLKRHADSLFDKQVPKQWCLNKVNKLFYKDDTLFTVVYGTGDSNNLAHLNAHTNARKALAQYINAANNRALDTPIENLNVCISTKHELNPYQPIKIIALVEVCLTDNIY